MFLIVESSEEAVVLEEFSVNADRVLICLQLIILLSNSDAWFSVL